MASIPLSGIWTWNDETKTLQLTRLNVSGGIKKKRKVSKMPTHQEIVSKHLLRILGLRSLVEGGSSDLKKASADMITLEDIKQVAVSLMREYDTLPITSGFLTVIKTKTVDGFLAALLLYLHLFWQRKTQEERSKSLMAVWSVTEQQMTAEASQDIKLDLAKKHLAVCYSSLVLGEGFPQQYCMVRVSPYTFRDSNLYQCLYRFFYYVAWVTFESRDLKDIENEISRLLYPDALNPILRAQEREEMEREITQKNSKTNSSIRKSRYKKDFISSLNQDAPLLRSILPSTRERVSNVLQRSSHHNQHVAKLIDTDVLINELSEELTSCSFGILGKPLSQLKHSKPMPHEPNTNDGETGDEDHVDIDNVDDDEEKDNPLTNNSGRKTTIGHQRSSTMTAEKHSSLSRAQTVASRATTEAPLSDTE